MNPLIWQIGSDQFFVEQQLNKRAVYQSDNHFRHQSVRVMSGINEALFCGKQSRQSELPDLPDLLVLLQSYPDQFPQAVFEELIETFSPSRIVVIYSPWCEGDGRNRQHMPLAVRVPLALAAMRIQQEIEILQGKRNLLPLTASRDEIFQFSLLGEKRELGKESLSGNEKMALKKQTAKRIQVRSADRPFVALIEDLLTAEGHSMQNSFSKDVDQVWVDVDPVDIDPTSGLAYWKEVIRQQSIDNPECRSIALTGFYDPDLKADLLSAGFSDVLPKLRIASILKFKVA